MQQMTVAVSFTVQGNTYEVAVTTLLPSVGATEDPLADTMAPTQETSPEYHPSAAAAAGRRAIDPEMQRVLSEAHWHLLRAETSCNLFWGEAWVYRTHKDLDDVAWHLGEGRAMLGDVVVAVPASPLPSPAPSPAPPQDAADADQS